MLLTLDMMANWCRPNGGCALASSLLSLLLLLPLIACNNSRDICKRDPPSTAASRTPGDNGFRIKIVGRPPPERYTPEQVYTVVINGTYPNQRLLGFMLVAVPLNAKDESTTMGTFQHLSTGATKFAENCPYVVTHTYPNPKAGVEVLWTAPPAGTGCIEFRATVLEYNDIWYKDDGALTVVFCEETGTTENHQSPEMIPDCCACGTAKYQMTFHGTWSHRTHPKQFPQKKRLLHWSNIVGASHSKHYTIWQYGGYATEGVRQVCEFAYTRILEEEMRQHSRDVRTVVKTPGIWWSDPHGLEQTRWARFSVDKKNHLVSMLAMLGPSPDWCVGVSALNLCLPNCTWIGDIEVKLYPWDAGTDDGVTYMSTNKRSNPQQKIHKITNTYPNNPQSPFFGPDPIKSLATLKIRRIHPKIGEQMVCTGQEEDFDRFDDDIEDSDDLTISEAERKKKLLLKEGKCAMSEWSDWSECSVTCGVGQMFRKRTYLNKDGNEDTCGEPTVESENCIGIETECEKPGEHCAVARWSDWSPCSVTCGKGTRERRRFYYDPNDEDRCDRKLVEIEICTAPILDCSKAISMLNFTAICSQPKDVGRCRADFTRYYYDTEEAKCLPFSYTGCRGNNNNFMTLEECLEMCFPVMQEAVLKQEEQSSALNTERARSEEIDVTDEKEALSATRLCSLPSESGPCKARLTRYYFDTTLLTCVPFRYGGCKGNENNFITESECMDTCFMVMKDEMVKRRLQQDKQLEIEGKQQAADKKANPQNEAEKLKITQTTSVPSSKKSKKGKKHKKHKGNKDVATADPNDGAKVDCVVTEWSGWSTCSSTCGRGYKYKRRAVKREAESGGKKCPRKLEKKKRCKMPKCQKGRHQQEVGVTRAEPQGEGHHQIHVMTRGKRAIDIVGETQRNNTAEIFRNDHLATTSREKEEVSGSKRKSSVEAHVAKKNERKWKRKQHKKKKVHTMKKKKGDISKKKKKDNMKKKKEQGDTLKRKKGGNTVKRKKGRVPSLKKKHERDDKLKKKNKGVDKEKKRHEVGNKKEKITHVIKKTNAESSLQKKQKHQSKSEKSDHKKRSKVKTKNSKKKLDSKKTYNINSMSVDYVNDTKVPGKLKGKRFRNSTQEMTRGQRASKIDKVASSKLEKKDVKHDKDRVVKDKKKGSKQKDHVKSQINKKMDTNSTSVLNGLNHQGMPKRKQSKRRKNRVRNKAHGDRISKKSKQTTVVNKDKNAKRDERKTGKKNRKKSSINKPESVVTPLPNDKMMKVRDCVITEWSDWSHCSVTCGRGLQFKRRIIEAVAKNGGKPCPIKLEMKRRCVLDKCTGELCI